MEADVTEERLVSCLKLAAEVLWDVSLTGLWSGGASSKPVDEYVRQLLLQQDSTDSAVMRDISDMLLSVALNRPHPLLHCLAARPKSAPVTDNVVNAVNWAVAAYYYSQREQLIGQGGKRQCLERIAASAGISPETIRKRFKGTGGRISEFEKTDYGQVAMKHVSILTDLFPDEKPQLLVLEMEGFARGAAASAGAASQRYEGLWAVPED